MRLGKVVKLGCGCIGSFILVVIVLSLVFDWGAINAENHYPEFLDAVAAGDESAVEEYWTYDYRDNRVEESYEIYWNFKLRMAVQSGLLDAGEEAWDKLCLDDKEGYEDSVELYLQIEKCETCDGKGFTFDLISRRCDGDDCRENLVSKLQATSPETGTKVVYMCIAHAGAMTAFVEKTNVGWDAVADSIDSIGRTRTANRFGSGPVETVLEHRSPSGSIPRSPYSIEPVVDGEMQKDCPDCSGAEDRPK